MSLQLGSLRDFRALVDPQSVSDASDFVMFRKLLECQSIMLSEATAMFFQIVQNIAKLQLCKVQPLCKRRHLWDGGANTSTALVAANLTKIQNSNSLYFCNGFYFCLLIKLKIRHKLIVSLHISILINYIRIRTQMN